MSYSKRSKFFSGLREWFSIPEKRDIWGLKLRSEEYQTGKCGMCKQYIVEWEGSVYCDKWQIGDSTPIEEAGFYVCLDCINRRPNFYREMIDMGFRLSVYGY